MYLTAYLRKKDDKNYWQKRQFMLKRNTG